MSQPDSETPGTDETAEGPPASSMEPGSPGEEAAPGAGDEHAPPRDSAPGDDEASRDQTAGGIADRVKQAFGGDD